MKQITFLKVLVRNFNDKRFTNESYGILVHVHKVVPNQQQCNDVLLEAVRAAEVDRRGAAARGAPAHQRVEVRCRCGTHEARTADAELPAEPSQLAPTAL